MGTPGRRKARFHGSPPDLQEKTAEFLRQRSGHIEAGRQFVSLDETSFGRHGRPVMGYARRGVPLYVKRRNCARITTKSALVCVSSDGLNMVKAIKDGAYNTTSFIQALETFDIPKDSVVLLDNVSFHHSKLIKQFAETNGFYLLYVPPYSPWFNPVEGVFSVVKRHFYKHGVPVAALTSVTNGVWK
jgi:hypothetical protein